MDPTTQTDRRMDRETLEAKKNTPLLCEGTSVCTGCALQGIRKREKRAAGAALGVHI